MKTRISLFVVIAAAALVNSGCGWLDQVVNGVSTVVGTSDTAIVIAKTAQIRTSYAVVAGDLLEVKRGDRLDVLDQVESPDTKGLFWFRVRAHDEARTEGWIEAQNVITNEVLDKSRKLAESFQNVPPQAAGQLRAASNLRLASDMSPENVLYKLASGSTFEISRRNEPVPHHRRLPSSSVALPDRCRRRNSHPRRRPIQVRELECRSSLACIRTTWRSKPRPPNRARRKSSTRR